MARTLFPEWIAQQAGTRYPFGESASLSNGEVSIPVGMFADAAVYPVGGGDGLHLTQVEIGFPSATVSIGTATNKKLASATFPLASPPETLTFEDVFGRPAGMLLATEGRLGEMMGWGVGVHVFDETQTAFATTCVFPTPEVGVRGVVLDDGSFFAGDFWLVGSDGVVLRKDEDKIRIDIVGDPLFRRKLCNGGEFSAPKFVRAIRFVASNGEFVATPDDLGTISLTTANNLAADSVLRIDFADDGIEIFAVGSPTDV